MARRWRPRIFPASQAWVLFRPPYNRRWFDGMPQYWQWYWNCVHEEALRLQRARRPVVRHDYELTREQSMSYFTTPRLLLDRLLRDLDEAVDAGLVSRAQVQSARDAVQTARARVLEQARVEREERQRHQED